MSGAEDCEGRVTHYEIKKTFSDKFSARRFLGIKQILDNGELEHVFWLSGLMPAADGMTGVKSAMIPPL